MDQADTLVELVVGLASEALVPGVRIIGIDGPSGSGKSTLARALAERTRAPVIEIDDFVSWSDFAGWWPRFDEQVLQPLLRGEAAHYQQRDWSDWHGDRLGGWRKVEWAPVVIVEGVTCTRREAAEQLACRVWIDTPAEERLRRGVARDGVEHRGLWERWMQQEEEFFTRDHTASRADVIVSGV